MTKNDLTAEIKRAAVRAVVDGLDSEDALAAVIAVAVWMIGTAPEPTARKAHLDNVLAMLPRAVAYVSAGMTAPRADGPDDRQADRVARWGPHIMTFEFTGAPNPKYPSGVDLDLSGGNPGCCFNTPYPAPRCGAIHVKCETCGATVTYTVAGRVDDPRSVKLACCGDFSIQEEGK